MFLFSKPLFTFLLLLPVCPRAACPGPYTDYSGQCVHISNFTTPWCSAAAYCLSIGGELLTELPAIRAVNRIKNYVYTGVTDLLVERQKGRSGWRFANGSLFPELGDADWAINKPNNQAAEDDSMVIGLGGLTDAEIGRGSYYFACQPIVTPNSSLLRRQEFLQLGNISPVYCFTDLETAGVPAATSQLLCLWECIKRWECRAVLHNTATGACRMLEFADSSVGVAIENNSAWQKYAKQYF